MIKLSNLIDVLAEINVFIAISYVSLNYKYSRPIINNKYEHSYLNITGIRHPLIEILHEDKFITNDISIGEKEHVGILLYGLNTCGKSILLKSVGIATILAQIGSFVPCEHMEYFPFNKIIPRISYDDNL